MSIRSIVTLLLLLLSPIDGAAQELAETASGAAEPAAAKPAPAQQSPIEELRRRVEVLADEVEKLRSGEPEQLELDDARRRALGLAPSAAATYRRATGGVSLAGYGEMLLENFARENEAGAGGAPTTRLDFLRAILYAGYRFNDEFLFNSEIEVEHSNEISVEFAYVDYLANDNLTFRGGLLLLPLGLVNEFHEPNVFIGARRPETEQRILPSTWRENGAGVLGSFGRVNFRAYAVNGMNGAAFRNNGLRGGRQKGGNARAANVAFAGRLDVTPVPGFFAGVGLYTGGSGQEQVVLNGERLDVGTTITEVHGQAQFRGADIRALFAHASIDDAGDVSRALGLPANAPVAETMRGGYVQIGYNVLSQVKTSLALTPYVRYEEVDTQHRVPAGFTRALAFDGDFKTLGVEFKPISNVVIKTDYQWLTNAAGTGRNQFNVNFGYAF
jgi:hypothetical protein